MSGHTIGPARPEWADRLLKVRVAAAIVGENSSTYYRKTNAGIYPPLVHIGRSSRVAGWELWDRLKSLMAERNEPEA